MIYQIVDKNGWLLKANFSVPTGLHLGSFVLVRLMPREVFRIKTVAGTVWAYVR